MAHRLLLVTSVDDERWPLWPPTASARSPVLEIGPGSDAQASVIVLHGLGADIRDFVAAAQRLRIPSSCRLRWLFPEAPLRPVTIAGGCRLRAWYDVRCYGRAEIDEDGIRASELVIREHIRREVARVVPPHRIVLAGFSQGGSLALHVGLRHPRQLGGIIALAAAVPLLHRIPRCRGKGPKVLMGHGLFDRVVRFGFGAASREFLRSCGYDVEWHSYLAGHSVCLRALQHVSRWLLRTLAPPVAPVAAWDAVRATGSLGSENAVAQAAGAGLEG